MSEDRLSLLWGITIASGATAQLLARITSLPGVVLLLASGLVVGRAGFHWVEPLDLGNGLGIQGERVEGGNILRREVRD
ncbi:MAG: hypothetical protein EBV10_07945, partial [Synechococcaceae bacterium WB6_1A_059]|nr:hypothetical protein [Synechococcaceae bacterium WB6_1A_059]